jgi:hypothetical protein
MSPLITYRPIGAVFPSPPDFRIVFRSPSVTVDLIWDAPEQVVAFDVTQALKITTVDAYQFTGREPRGLAEVPGSGWLADLTRVVAVTDAGAHSMTRSHHYIIVGYDDVLEVAAFDAKVTRL